MTLAIGLILASVALPMMVSAVQKYRLNSVTQQTANLIDMTRYTAVRRNALISFRKATQGPNTVFYVDLKGSSALDPIDPQMVIPTDMQIANGQPLTPAANTTGIPQTQDFSTQITFDYRGTVSFPVGGANSTYFLAIGYASQTQYGVRAITVTPMGQTKMWTAPEGGPWTGM